MAIFAQVAAACSFYAYPASLACDVQRLAEALGICNNHVANADTLIQSAWVAGTGCVALQTSLLPRPIRKNH
jgi:hypothetical protein